jgi:hypothetical protein
MGRRAGVIGVQAHLLHCFQVPDQVLWVEAQTSADVECVSRGHDRAPHAADQQLLPGPPPRDAAVALNQRHGKHRAPRHDDDKKHALLGEARQRSLSRDLNTEGGAALHGRDDLPESLSGSRRVAIHDHLPGVVKVVGIPTL